MPTIQYTRMSVVTDRYQRPSRRLLPLDPTVVAVCSLGIIEIIFAAVIFITGVIYSSKLNDLEYEKFKKRELDRNPRMPDLDLAPEPAPEPVFFDGAAMGQFLHAYDIPCILLGGVGIFAGLASVLGVLFSNKCMITTHFAVSLVGAFSSGYLCLVGAQIVHFFSQPSPLKGFKFSDHYLNWQVAIIWINVIVSAALCLCFILSTCFVCNLWSDGVLTQPESSSQRLLSSSTPSDSQPTHPPPGEKPKSWSQPPLIPPNQHEKNPESKREPPVPPPSDTVPRPSEGP